MLLFIDNGLKQLISKKKIWKNNSKNSKQDVYILIVICYVYQKLRKRLVLIFAI